MGYHHEIRDPGLQEPQLLQLHSPAERKTLFLWIFIYELKGRIVSPGYANYCDQRKVGLLTIMMYVHWALTIKEGIAVAHPGVFRLWKSTEGFKTWNSHDQNTVLRSLCDELEEEAKEYGRPVRRLIQQHRTEDIKFRLKWRRIMKIRQMQEIFRRKYQ